ncbi:MAG: NPCBM/NEW2 domain-containing protein [Planctomycetes bacterium]|nr:NPCBM/NEW2 domain-containing protein [Planctomycetota bacterium]
MRGSAPARWTCLLLLAAGAGAAEPAGWALTDQGTVAAAGATAAWSAAVATQLPGEVASWIDQGLVSAAGDVLRGSVEGLAAGSLRLRSDLAGDLALPAERVALVVLAPLPLATAQAEAQSASPGLLLANGSRTAGTVTAIDERTVAVDTGRRVLAIPRERVVAARLASSNARAAGTWVRLANGDRLVGTLAATATGAVTVEGLCGRRELPPGWLRAGGGGGERRLFLEAVPPAAASYLSVAGEAPTGAADRAADGGWVVAGGLRGERALAWRCGQEATWELDGGWQRLVALVALEDGPGAAVFRVDGDGRTLFTSQAQGARQPARPLAVPLAGVRRLRLAVLAPVEGASAGARAVWLYPTVVK